MSEVVAVPDWRRLLPRLEGADPVVCAIANGGVEAAIGCSVLFWPYFVTHDGMVFLSFNGCEFDESKAENVRVWMKSCDDDRSRVEAVLNHRHICDLLWGAKPQASDEQQLFLAARLKESWSRKLQQDFPDRRFKCEVFGEEGLVPLDVEVTFYEIRAAERDQEIG